MIRRPSGFTLIELLIGTVIAVVTVLGLSASTLSGMRANRFSERYTHAASLAQQELARLRADLRAGVPVAAGNDEDGIFRIAWAFPPVTSAPAGVDPAELMGIRVTVSWEPPVGAVPLTFDTIVDLGGS